MGAMCESKAVYCIGAALLIVGCLLLAVFSSEYAPGYSYSRDFSLVTCDVQTSSFVGNVCCEAAVQAVEDCSENYIYPCLLITANVTSSGDQAVLYDDVKSALYGGRIEDCSYFHCDSRSYEKRLEDVTSFADSHKPGSSHDCYYGQKDSAGRALRSTVTSDDLMPAIIVPILLIVAGVVVCIVMAVISKVQDKQAVSVIPPSEENLKREHDSDDSDIETIEISTTITTVSARSEKGSRSNVASNSPVKHNTSFSRHQ